MRGVGGETKVVSSLLPHFAVPRRKKKKKASSSLFFLTEKSKEEERVLLLYVRFGWGLRRGKYLEILGKFCIKKVVSSSSNHSMA